MFTLTLVNVTLVSLNINLGPANTFTPKSINILLISLNVIIDPTNAFGSLFPIY